MEFRAVQVGDEAILPFQAQAQVADARRVGDFERDPDVERGVLGEHFRADIAVFAQQRFIGTPGAVIADSRGTSVPCRVVKVSSCPIGHWSRGYVPFCLSPGGEKGDRSFALNANSVGDVFGLLRVVSKFAGDGDPVRLYQCEVSASLLLQAEVGVRIARSVRPVFAGSENHRIPAARHLDCWKLPLGGNGRIVGQIPAAEIPGDP